jgi:hypothetical protein
MAVNRIKGAFAPPKKGETYELRAGLISQYASERKEAIQKTIMSMTLGKDVSALFPDVLKNMATSDLDQKKLVYLYLMYVYTGSSKTCVSGILTSTLGIMQNRIQIFVFWRSTRSCKIRRILIHWFGRLRYGQWGVFGWIK